MHIKVTKIGEDWFGAINCETVPRIGEIVHLGDKKGYRVASVHYSAETDHYDPNAGITHHPLLGLNPEPID